MHFITHIYPYSAFVNKFYFAASELIFDLFLGTFFEKLVRPLY